MYKIRLINMPFTNLGLPSIALTQLKEVLKQKFGNQVDVEIVYLSYDFAKYLGLEFYSLITGSHESQNSGLGDWFFREVAFAESKNNTGIYFKRYFPSNTEKFNRLKSLILEHRRGLDQFMEGLVTKYELEEADMVGFTSMFMQNVASFAMAKKLKQRKPSITVVMGGANCESPMGQMIVKNVSHIDYVFSGPALKTLPEFVQHYMNKEFNVCNSIKGVFSKKNFLFQSGSDAIGEELSIDVPIKLDYEPFLKTFENNFSNEEIKPILLFETSRGCWWGERAHCTFCGLNGISMAYRAMNPELALEQLNYLFRFSDKVSRLEAVDNILPKSYLEEVLPFVETPANVSIFYEVKADLTEPQVEVLAKSRVKFIQPGIESLATSTLKLMKKGTSAFTNLTLLKNCTTYDITPHWNLLVGFPGEGEEVYEKYVEDIPLLTHLPPPSGVYPVRFDRYSPYFMKPEEYGLKLEPLDYYHLIYPFDENALAAMAYYFADLNTTAPYITTMTKWIGKIREQVAQWIAHWSNPSLSILPELFLKQGESEYIVYDSRSGEAVEHRLSVFGKDILNFLDKPRHIGDVHKETGRQLGVDAEKEITALKEKGLIFQEGDRFLSLVLGRRAAK
jgi:ribosomal peptide maturation radical SAM protein 1